SPPTAPPTGYYPPTCSAGASSPAPTSTTPATSTAGSPTATAPPRRPSPPSSTNPPAPASKTATGSAFGADRLTLLAATSRTDPRLGRSRPCPQTAPATSTAPTPAADT